MGRSLTKVEAKDAVKGYIKTMSQSELIFCIDSNAHDFLVKGAGLETVNLSNPKKE